MRLFYSPEKRDPAALLFRNERFAVGALAHRRVCLMCADSNAVESAIILSLTVVCTLLNSTADALVGFAIHEKFLLFSEIQSRNACFLFRARFRLGTKLFYPCVRSIYWGKFFNRLIFIGIYFHFVVECLKLLCYNIIFRKTKISIIVSKI